MSSPTIDFSKYETSAPPIDFSKYESGTPVQPPSALSRLGHSFLSGLGVTSDEDAKNFFEHPINTFLNSMNAQGELAQKAKDAYQRGDYKSAVIHGLNYLVPFIGQQTDKAGEQLSQGDIAGGVGRTLGVAVPMVAGSPEVQAGAKSAAGAVADAAKPVVAKTARVASDIVDPELTGIISPRLAHAQRVAGRVADALEKKNVPEVEPPASSSAPAPETAAPQPSAPAATPAAAKVIEQQLQDSLGGQKLIPGVSLKNQPAAMRAAAGKLPEGFTPVDSTALKGYKYDPESKEFESITQGGQHYIHGDVSPEEVQSFTDADSKGKAWQDIRQNPLVAKVVNGKRIPVVKPRTLADLGGQSAPAETAAPKNVRTLANLSGAGDLTSLLQQSLDTVKAPKGGVATTAAPSDLANRWGVDEDSIVDTDRNVRGLTAQQSEDYISKLTKAYKTGQPVEPVMETRDANNNIISVDGRHRAIAAQRAGIQRIPVIVRRIGSVQ